MSFYSFLTKYTMSRSWVFWSSAQICVNTVGPATAGLETPGCTLLWMPVSWGAGGHLHLCQHPYLLGFSLLQPQFILKANFWATAKQPSKQNRPTIYPKTLQPHPETPECWIYPFPSSLWSRPFGGEGGKSFVMNFFCFSSSFWKGYSLWKDCVWMRIGMSVLSMFNKAAEKLTIDCWYTLGQARQAPLSMGSPRREYWSGQTVPS